MKFILLLVCAFAVVQGQPWGKPWGKPKGPPHGKPPGPFPKPPGSPKHSGSHEGHPPPGEVNLHFHCGCKKGDHPMTTEGPPPTEEPVTEPVEKREERQVPMPPPDQAVPGHMKEFMGKLGLHCKCEAINIDGVVSFPFPHSPHGPHPPGPGPKSDESGSSEDSYGSYGSYGY